MDFPVSEKIRNFFYKYRDVQKQPQRLKINLDFIQDLFYPNVVNYQIIGRFNQQFSKSEFVKSMLSSSYAPHFESKLYYDYVKEANTIFYKFSKANFIQYTFKIHLYHLTINNCHV